MFTLITGLYQAHHTSRATAMLGTMGHTLSYIASSQYRQELAKEVAKEMAKETGDNRGTSSHARSGEVGAGWV